MLTVIDATPAMTSGFRSTLAPAAIPGFPTLGDGIPTDGTLGMFEWSKTADLPILQKLIDSSSWSGCTVEKKFYTRVDPTSLRVEPNGCCYLEFDAKLAKQNDNVRPYRDSAIAAISVGLPIMVELIRERDGIRSGQPRMVVAINEDGTRGAIISHPQAAA